MNTYDLFVSYSRRDNAQGRVKELVDQISRDFEAFAGRPLRTFFDVEEIHGMDDWRHRILRGLRESRLLLAFLSPRYLKSDYCEWEFNEYLKHELGEGLVSEGVAPIYFVEVEGWKDRNFEQHSAEWVVELRRRQHFDLQPFYHHGEEALRTQAVQERMAHLAERLRDRIRRGELREKAKGNVDKYNVNFSGRTTEMRLLRESASLKQVGVLTAVQGLGGIGKTALACAYAHTYAEEYPGGCWQVKCEGRQDLRAALISLAGARDFVFEFTEEEKRDLDLGFERVLRELKKRAEAAEPKRVLVILDNVDRAELLAPAQTQRLPSADWLHFIATTRLGEAELGRAADRCFVTISELPEKEAVDLIEKWQPDGSFPNEAERQAAHALARLLGGFTLAVEAAAVYLGQKAGEVTCAGFAERLEKEGLGGLEAAVSDPVIRLQHDEKRLSVTLQSTFDLLSPADHAVLTYAALLPADEVVPGWIRPLAAKEFPELGQDAEPGYPDPWGKILNKLTSLRFFQLTAEFNVVRVHRLVQELVRERADHWRIQELELALIDAVEKRGAFLFHGWVNPETRWELKPLAACAEHWMGEKFWEKGGATIAALAAVPLGDLARYAEAEALLRRALAIQENNFGPDDPGVAAILNNLGGLLTQTNRIAEAEASFRRAVAIYEKNLGPDHPDVATVLNNLGAIFMATTRRAEAEGLYRRSLAIVEKSLGPDDPRATNSLINLANVYRDTGRPTEAEALYRRALALLEKGPNPDHPNVSIVLDNLAILLAATNRAAEAEPLYRQALAKLERSLGPDHPQVASSLHNLAVTLRDTGRQPEAEALFRRALAIREKSLDPNNPDIYDSVYNLAKLLNATHRPSEAEPLYRRALALRERNRGTDDPGVAAYLYDLATLLQETGRKAEADPLHRRAAEILAKNRQQNHPALAGLTLKSDPAPIDPEKAKMEAAHRRTLASREKTLGLDHPDLIAPLNNLANVLQDTGRQIEAESLLRRALAIREKKFGPSDPVVATLTNNLALLLSDNNRLGEAEALFQQGLDAQEKILGPDDPRVALTLNNYASLLFKANRMAEAEPLIRRTVAIWEKTLGPDNPDIAVALSTLAAVLRDTGRPAEAVPLCRRALAIQEKAFGPEDPSIVQALLNLLAVLAKSNQLEEVKPMVQRLTAIREKNLKLGKPELAPLGNRPGAMPVKTGWLKRMFKGS